MAHGEPISHLPADWESIMKGFKQKHGANIPEYHLPHQSYFEGFFEKANEGRLLPRLSHKWSVSEKRRDK